MTHTEDVAPPRAVDDKAPKLRRGWWLYTLVAGILSAVAAFAFVSNEDPQRTAQVVMVVSPPAEVPGTQQASSFAVDPQRRVETAAAQVTTKAFQDSIKPAGVPTEVVAEPQPGTDLVFVTATAPTDEQAAQLASATVRKYQVMVGERALASAGSRYASTLRALSALRANRALERSSEAAQLRVQLSALRAFQGRDPEVVGSTDGGIATVGEVTVSGPPSTVSRYGAVVLAALLAMAVVFSAFVLEASLRRPRR